MNTGLGAIGLLLVATTVAAAEMRTWTFEASGKTMQGEVAGFTGDAVTLKGADGKAFSVPIAYLTENDRIYLAGERANQWKQVEVVKLDAATAVGRYKKCTVHGAGANGEIFIERLPASVEAILNKRNQQAAAIAALSGQIKSADRAVQEAKASIPPGASRNRVYRRAYAAERAQLNLEAQDPSKARVNLANLQKSYDDYVQQTKHQTMVKMRNTGVEYKGLPLWECFDARRPQG